MYIDKSAVQIVPQMGYSDGAITEPSVMLKTTTNGKSGHQLWAMDKHCTIYNVHPKIRHDGGDELVFDLVYPIRWKEEASQGFASCQDLTLALDKFIDALSDTKDFIDSRYERKEDRLNELVRDLGGEANLSLREMQTLDRLVAKGIDRLRTEQEGDRELVDTHAQIRFLAEWEVALGVCPMIDMDWLEG